MEEKDKTIEQNEVKNVKAEGEKQEIPFKYGIGPSLVINMVKMDRVYRFEMPIGAKLDECEVACNECLKIVKKMKEDAEAKIAEEKAKKESESSGKESKKEDK